jgi:hypothetical protein
MKVKKTEPQLYEEIVMEKGVGVKLKIMKYSIFRSILWQSD